MSRRHALPAKAESSGTVELIVAGLAVAGTLAVAGRELAGAISGAVDLGWEILDRWRPPEQGHRPSSKPPTIDQTGRRVRVKR